jgi:hypothetical protein
VGFSTALFGGKMRVRDVLIEVARIAEGNDLSKKIQENKELLDEQVKEKTDALLKCYNAVLKDITTNYYEYASSVSISEKSINLSSLTEPFIKIISVTDTKGNPVSYTVAGDMMTVDETPFVLCYRAAALDQEIDDEFMFLGRAIGDNVFVYGVLSEYLMREFRFEEAQSWESKFRQAVNFRTDYKKRKLKAGKRWGL